MKVIVELIPLGVTNNTITASNAGIGSMNVYTNSGGSSLGTYYGLEGPGYGQASMV